MFDRESLIEIVSGERRGLIPMMVRSCLLCLTVPYRFAVAWRNRSYDRGRNVTQVESPVISVGNLTTGGTGKSPLVIWLAQFIRQQNKRVAVLSRGYGAKPNQVSDEAMELEQRLVDVPHLQNANRVDAARVAIDELEMEVLVLDDAFQHRKIVRSLDVVLIDCTRPFGFGHLIPRGLLREPLNSLKRADMIILTRCNQITAAELLDIRQRLQVHCDCPIAQVQARPSHLLQADGQTASIESWAPKNTFAFCGIGNHENFWATLETLEFRVQGKMPFPDHHNYDREDINRIGSAAARCNADAIICTHKDLVKIDVNQLNGINVYALIVDVEFLEGQQEFEQLVLEVLSDSG